MYYCENCNIKSETQRCPRCGKRNLRPIKADDFCFCCQISAGAAEELKRHLETQNIGCALIPYGTGLNARRAMA